MPSCYQLFNPIEGDKVVVPTLVNHTGETLHPIEPVVFIQLQAEATFGVRLGVKRLSELLVQFYGYRVIRDGLGNTQRVDVRQAREDADTNDVYANESLERHGLFAALRQSIPGGVITLSERLMEVD